MLPNPQTSPLWAKLIKIRKDMKTIMKNNKHHLHIELTEQQYELLKRNCKASGLTMRLYLVRLLEGTPIKARPSSEIRELRTEIHKIGSNINQIACSINAEQGSSELAEKSLFLLGKVYEMMYKIAKQK